MDFRILGPLEVRAEPGAVALGGAKPRAVLAVLLLNANEPVSADRLATALWGDDAPSGAAKTVQVYVSRLRKALGDPDVVTTTPAGYRLHVEPDELDAERFARHVEEGRVALAAGRPERAGTILREALSLWRGPPLADVAFEPFAQAEIARLEEQRLSALELRVEADLAAGRHAALAGELQHLVARHRGRERLAGQLMLALYRCERQTEALEAYRDARSALVEEAGIEPGPQLRALHEAILRQDPSLDLPAPASELPEALDTGGDTPFAGRDDELDALRARWEQVRGGTGAAVTVTGPRGIGKSRLAAELAHGIHTSGGIVMHAAGDGPAETLRTVLRDASEAKRPTLVVVDDADRAGADERAELARLAGAVPGLPVLLLAEGEDPCIGALDGGAALDIELEPLDAAAVETIARGYAAGRAVPVGALLEASHGVPSAVHEAAGEWARREAADRVTVAAGEAADGRSRLRTMEAEVAEGVVDLQRARERAALAVEPGAPVICPFKGLAAFGPEDADYFFGRERLVAELVARLVGAPLLGIVGASGTGKSSVLRAGLLPALERGILPGSDDWGRVLIRPGEHPQRELDRALEHVLERSRLLIAVDQFEEVFTACDDDRERVEFIGRLVAAARDPLGRSVVVLTIRADHYERCAAYPELSDLLAANHVLVTPMRREELRDAVERPALRVGLRVEPALADALVADVEGEPGALPLLSTALLELWRLREGRRLRHAAYERTGGVRGAVARLAEEAFGQLDPAQQVVARSTLVRLATETADGAIERRRVPLAELETEGGDVAAVIARFTDHRLLTVSAGSVEVAHEALLREWPRLRDWIHEDRESMRIHRGVTAAAEEWQRLDYDDGALFRGTHLIEAREWRAAYQPVLNELERFFLDTSQARWQGERIARRRRIRLAFACLFAALAIITTVAIVALYQGREAERQRDIAASRELAARATTFLDGDPGLSLALALRALDRRNTEQARDVLRQATLSSRALSAWPAHRDWVMSLEPSPDGRRIVTAGRDGAVRVWDPVSGRALVSLDAHREWALGASLSPDGRSVASAGDDGVVAIWDLGTGAKRVLLQQPDTRLPAGVTYAPDGRRVVVPMFDGTVRVIPVDGDGERQVLHGHQDVVFSAQFSPDGRRVVSAGVDGTARIWDLATGAATVLRHPGPVFSTGFSPDGRRVVTGGADGAVRIWDVADPETPTVIRASRETMESVQFSPDGRRVVSAGDDSVVRVFDAHGGPPLEELRGHKGTVMRATFVPGTDTIASAGEDKVLRRWASSPAAVLRAPVTSAAYNADGTEVVSGGLRGPLRVWNPATGAVTVLRGHDKQSFPEFSPDGRRIVSASSDGTVRVWERGSGRSKVVFSNDTDVFAATFDPSGQHLAIARGLPTIVVLDLDSGDQALLRGHTAAVSDVAFSRDGTQLASTSNDGTVRLWDPSSGELRHTFKGHAQSVNSIAFSRDGRRLVSAGVDGTIRVWSVAGGPPVVLRGHDGSVSAAAFDASGDRVVSAGQDGTVRVWSSRGGEALVVLFRHRGPARSAQFSPDGRNVLSSGGGIVRVSSCEVCGSLASVLQLARTRAARELSPAERQRLLPSGG